MITQCAALFLYLEPDASNQNHKYPCLNTVSGTRSIMPPQAQCEMRSILIHVFPETAKENASLLIL